MNVAAQARALYKCEGLQNGEQKVDFFNFMTWNCDIFVLDTQFQLK